MAQGEGEFGREELGVRGDNGGAEEMAGAVSEQFNEAVVEIRDFGDFGVGKFDKNFAIFAIFADEFSFGEAKSGDFWESFDGADEALIIDRVFDFV